jgi:hypothetical protein
LFPDVGNSSHGITPRRAADESSRLMLIDLGSGVDR